MYSDLRSRLLSVVFLCKVCGTLCIRAWRTSTDLAWLATTDLLGASVLLEMALSALCLTSICANSSRISTNPDLVFAMTAMLVSAMLSMSLPAIQLASMLRRLPVLRVRLLRQEGPATGNPCAPGLPEPAVRYALVPALLKMRRLSGCSLGKTIVADSRVVAPK